MIDYAEEMRKFEKTELFKNFYYRFVNGLKNAKRKYSSSKQLEEHFKLSAREIRELAKHARRNGILITSSVKGYAYATTRKEAENTLVGLLSRIQGLQVTVDAIKNSEHFKKLMGLDE